MGDAELVQLAQHAEDMSANDRVPPAERVLWRQIQQEVSTYLGAAQDTPPGPGLFDE